MPNWGNEQSVANTEVWLTPPPLVRALGKFDLDPCAAENMPWQIATNSYTEKDNGLTQRWQGRVFMNPPYGTKLDPFLHKLAEHGNGIALVFARTETRAFFRNVWTRADAIMFLKGRVKFYRPDGTQGQSSGSPSCLIAYGPNNVQALYESNLEGVVIPLNDMKLIHDGTQLG
jgi:hypothetical protein